MSALWDKLTGKDEHHDQPAPGNMNETHPVVTESTTQAVPLKPKDEDHAFSFSKLKEVLGGTSPGKTQQPDLPPPHPTTHTEHNQPTTQPKDKRDWHEKFKDLLDQGASNKQEAEEQRLRLERAAAEADVAAREAEEKASVKGKFKGLFKSDEEEAAEHQRLVEEAIAKRRAAADAKRKEDSFREKIKDVFDDDDEEKERERRRLEEEAKRNHSFGAHIRNIFGHDEPPKEPEKKDWKDKLNELAGGGAKAEAKEGKLDKAIDFYQEHVLHKGSQDHESAIEQAKDAQIAHAIRHGLGLKDKDDKDHKH
ncbi:hypothetical protein CPB86DRAFT_780366 [Serendipita vermifera]|nr:hypothetical protein CPB86DRAFT_780366 [Serendipita vermifera]